MLKVPLLPHVDPLTVTALLLPRVVEPIVAPALMRLPPATISWLLAPSFPTVITPPTTADAPLVRISRLLAPDPPTASVLVLLQTEPAPVTVTKLFPLELADPMLPAVLMTCAPSEMVSWPFPALLALPSVRLPMFLQIEPIPVTITELLLAPLNAPIIPAPL